MTRRALVRRGSAVLGVVLAASALAVSSILLHRSPEQRSPEKRQHVHDETGLMTDMPGWEALLGAIFDESGIDLRFFFVNDLAGETLEAAALQRMQALKIGGQTASERGALFLYDTAGQRLRIEVGYGLEEYFPDAFLHYLMTDHVRAVFAGGDPSVGLAWTLEMLHHRIRSEILGNRFDPRVLRLLRTRRPLSGGAGASAAIPRGHGPAQFLQPRLAGPTRERFAAPATPEQAYQRYLDWLALGHFDPDVEIFTPESRRFLSGFPMTRAYFDWLLFQQYGKAYAVEQRGDLALLYFTDDPLLAPRLLRWNGRRWQLDLVAAVRNQRKFVGGPFTWDYVGRDDDFSRVFADKVVEIDGFGRIAAGDNRRLPTSRPDLIYRGDR